MLRLRGRLDQPDADGSDAGFTLVELLVTMTIMSIVSAFALTWLLGEGASDTKTQNSSFATSDARAVLDTWPAMLRVADSPWNGQTSLPTPGGTSSLATVATGSSTGRFLAISTTSLTFNANLNNAPAATCGDSCARSDTTQVTLALSGGALTQTLVTRSSSATTTLVHSGAGATSNNACLFTAYSATGATLGCTASTPLGAIARIVLAFNVTPDGGGSAQSYTTSVSITGSFASVPTASTTAGA